MPDPSQFRALSPRQMECLRLAADGNSSPEIALLLGISRRTVDQRIAEACDRLQVRNRTQAVAEAVRLGLI
ncbi:MULTISPECIES: helix-turn-helix transcriptional regulator [Brevundimonas]|uniref:helix-turn-helix transcriptional regulator n=1 Tax=Brevundimonas TaxID=41275 RepID=UPI0028AECD3C|nr:MULTISPECIES: helix-turn-helix transcriptional regulator [Brevundimonas]